MLTLSPFAYSINLLVGRLEADLSFFQKHRKRFKRPHHNIIKMHAVDLDEAFAVLDNRLNDGQATSDSDIGGWTDTYYEGHQDRYRETIEWFVSAYDGGRIIDLGCVPCHITFLLKQLDYPVTGVDIAPERVSDFVKNNEMDIVKADLERECLPFDEDSVSHVIFSEVFEHLRLNPIGTLEDIYRILDKKGTLYLSTPNLYALRHRLSYVTGAGLYGSPYEEFEKLRKLGHMGHMRVYTSEEMRTFLERSGFKVQNVKFTNFGIPDYFSHFPAPLAMLCYALWPNTRRFLMIQAVKKNA